MLLHCIELTQRIFLLQFFSSDKSTLSYITKIKIESTINRAKIHVFLSYHNLFDRKTNVYYYIYLPLDWNNIMTWINIIFHSTLFVYFRSKFHTLLSWTRCTLKTTSLWRNLKQTLQLIWVIQFMSHNKTACTLSLFHLITTIACLVFIFHVYKM